MIPKNLQRRLTLWSALVLVAMAAPAHAGTWATSFDPRALETLAIPGRTRVTLVAAGAPSPALDDAREALGAALKSAGRWTAVDFDLVREHDEALGDREILELERAARVVEAVWILRLVPASEDGGPPTAVVNVYAPLGALIGGFHVARGQAPYVVDGARDPAAEYLRQRISPVVAGRIVETRDEASFTFEGGFAKDGTRLAEPRDLYLAMGRDDLVTRYDDASESRTIWTLVSGGAIFVGTILFMQDVFDDGGIPTLDIGALGVSGAVVGGLGAIGLVYALTIDPDPLDFDGKVDAVRRYNGELKPRFDLSVSPGGATVTLGGAF